MKPEGPESNTPSEDRRGFLAGAGKLAIALPAAIGLLGSAAAPAAAQARKAKPAGKGGRPMYIDSDAPIIDPDYPPSGATTHFMSQGAVVHCRLSLAQGPEPKGCVILPPSVFGYGIETLIYPLTSSGISVMTFNPRGMWDGTVKVTTETVLDDLKAAVNFLRTADAAGKKTGSGQSYRIDPARIASCGVSGGGGTTSFIACAEMPELNHAIALAPANMEPFRNAKLPDPTPVYDTLYRETAGRIDNGYRERVRTPESIDRMSIIRHVPELLSKKLLLVGASHDTTTPIATHHEPIARAFLEAKAPYFKEMILDTDHGFSDKRVALSRIVIDWLRTDCGF